MTTLAVLRRSWPAAFVAGIAARMLVDPATEHYYTTGFVLAALLYELDRWPGRLPWRTGLAARDPRRRRVGPHRSAATWPSSGSGCWPGRSSPSSPSPTEPSSRGPSGRTYARLVSELLRLLYQGKRDEAAELLAAEPPPTLDIFEAAAAGDAGGLAELLAADEKLATAWTDDGFTALHYACFFGTAAAAAALLDAGADADVASRNDMAVRPINSAAAGTEPVADASPPSWPTAPT